MQGSYAPPVQPSPQQANASPEQAKAPPESRNNVGTLGQQQLIKRILSDLVTQKAQRAASNQESGAKDNSPQSACQRSAPPPEANSSPDDSGRAAVQNLQNGPIHRSAASEGRSTPGNLSRAAVHNGQNGPSPRPNASHVSGSTGDDGRDAALQNGPRQHSSPPKGSSNPGIKSRPAVPPNQHRSAAPRPQPSSSMGNNRPMPQQYSDRHMAQQKKVPYVPVVPRSDSRYKTTLCMYHQKGRCPRGDGCSFAHSISELRKKPQKQVAPADAPFQCFIAWTDGCPVLLMPKSFDSGLQFSGPCRWCFMCYGRAVVLRLLTGRKAFETA